MKAVLHTLVALVAAGRGSMLGWYVLLALLFLSVLLSGCAQFDDTSLASVAAVLSRRI